MKNTTKNVLIGSGAAAVAGLAAAGAVSHTITNYLMKVALDREMPKVKNVDKARAQLCGIPNAEAFFELLERSGRHLRNCGCETVEISSYDGEKLVGHWHDCENPRRVMIAMHGWRSNWAKDFGMISDFWHDNG